MLRSPTIPDAPDVSMATRVQPLVFTTELMSTEVVCQLLPDGVAGGKLNLCLPLNM